MPFVSIPAGEGSLYYSVDSPDSGRSQAPWLLLCNSLGASSDMWRPQVAALAAQFRVLRYDRRGHGRSSTPAGPYTIEDLAGDALAVLDHAGAERAHFCGLSMGGLVGQWLALNAPQRIERLVLCSTAAKIGTAEGWMARIGQVHAHGLQEIADGSVLRWFTPAFREREPAAVNEVRQQLLATSPEGYAACCGVLIDADFRADLGRIKAPTLAIAGIDDPVTPPADLRSIAGGVPDGRQIDLPGAHLCNIESPSQFNAAVLDFLRY
ncbi:3-oxoadipate enol-lactonase [Nevskia soli]|uniref:3-oxoadipate enol-lactonase n=1 Tax=Nevskia soli TaxID=418856 RepID=UPI0004A6AB9F|nr:3-oxoadipate enol-lactonase [Nevskia soli]